MMNVNALSTQSSCVRLRITKLLRVSCLIGAIRSVDTLIVYRCCHDHLECTLFPWRQRGLSERKTVAVHVAIQKRMIKC